MDLIQCPESKNEHSEHARDCPNYGYSNSRKIKKDAVDSASNSVKG